MTEDEMAEWHHRLNGHEFVQAPKDGEGRGSLVCCSPWGRRFRHESATEQQKQQLKTKFYTDTNGKVLAQRSE